MQLQNPLEVLAESRGRKTHVDKEREPQSRQGQELKLSCREVSFIYFLLRKTLWRYNGYTGKCANARQTGLHPCDYHPDQDMEHLHCPELPGACTQARPSSAEGNHSQHSKELTCS